MAITIGPAESKMCLRGPAESGELEGCGNRLNATITARALAVAAIAMIRSESYRAPPMTRAAMAPVAAPITTRDDNIAQKSRKPLRSADRAVALVWSLLARSRIGLLEAAIARRRSLLHPFQRMARTGKTLRPRGETLEAKS
jgi:hypothetical protein